MNEDEHLEASYEEKQSMDEARVSYEEHRKIKETQRRYEAEQCIACGQPLEDINYIRCFKCRGELKSMRDE